MFNNIYNQDSDKLISPWSKHIDSEFLFSIISYEKLLDYLKLDIKLFQEDWTIKYENILKKLISFPIVKYDWAWSIYLRLISYIKNYLYSNKSPLIIGISGLPGCGKTSFGKIFEHISSEMNIPVNVISLDDFYYPSPQLDFVMKGNPWNVPRGLPGSHSIIEIDKCLNQFLNNGNLVAPRFDKSLRKGLGDREGWIELNPKVLILEGWFLGCLPVKCLDSNNQLESSLDPPLTSNELDYRKIVQKNLIEYLPIWEKLKHIFHIKANCFSNTFTWKTQQERNMHVKTGHSLQGDNLKSFIRMISASIPQYTLQNINSHITIEINQSRQVIFAGIS